jgi:hypothetical protein
MRHVIGQYAACILVTMALGSYGSTITARMKRMVQTILTRTYRTFDVPGGRCEGPIPPGQQERNVTLSMLAHAFLAVTALPAARRPATRCTNGPAAAAGPERGRAACGQPLRPGENIQPRCRS